MQCELRELSEHPRGQVSSVKGPDCSDETGFLHGQGALRAPGLVLQQMLSARLDLSFWGVVAFSH